MAAIHGYIESYDYKQMYNIQDWKGTIPKPTLNSNSITSFLRNNSDYSYFYYLLTISGLLETYNCTQAKFTLFVPSDETIKNRFPETFIQNMDRYTARQIILYNTMNTRNPLAFYKNSPAKYVTTRLDGQKLLIENISGVTTIDRLAKIIEGDILLDNGIIHIVNNLIVPPSFSIGNMS